MESAAVEERSGQGPGGPVETGCVEAVRDELRLAEIDAQVGVLSAQIHALSARLVDLVADFDRSGGAHGYTTTAQWLSIRGGFTPGEARRVVGVAQRQDELPTLMAHAHAGRRSVGVIAAAARVVTPENEAAVAEVVVSTTPAQSSRILSTYRSVRDSSDQDPCTGSDDHDAPGPPPPAPPTWWRSWFDDAGRGRIDAALSPEVAALVQQAWDAARAAGEADRARNAAADAGEAERDLDRRLDADEVASRWATTMLDHAHDHGLCRPGGDRHGILVNIDVATLARVLGLSFDPTIPVGLGTQAFDARTGAHLGDHDVARLLCDADLQLLVHHDGVPLWMSNPTRSANRHQRRALQFRASGTGGCEYPGCTQTRYLDAHHVVFWSCDGRTTLDNLVLLCGHHHRALHRGDYCITTTGDQRFTFTDRHRQHLGTSSTQCGAGTGTGASPPGTGLPPPGRAPHPPAEPAPLPGIGPDTPRSLTGGEHLTAYALDVYLSHLLAA
jgi:hypothetical protein